MKCYVCKKNIAPEFLALGWETYRGYERAHCSIKCKRVTQSKKVRPTLRSADVLAHGESAGQSSEAPARG